MQPEAWGEKYTPPAYPILEIIFRYAASPEGHHAMVSDPGEVSIALPLTAMPMLTSTILTVSSFPTRQLRGSIPSTFRLTAYLLAVLRLRPDVTTRHPRTRYPVDGHPSGAGFTPAGLLDLARPHKYTVPGIHNVKKEGRRKSTLF